MQMFISSFLSLHVCVYLYSNDYDDDEFFFLQCNDMHAILFSKNDEILRWCQFLCQSKIDMHFSLLENLHLIPALGISICIKKSREKKYWRFEAKIIFVVFKVVDYFILIKLYCLRKRTAIDFSGIIMQILYFDACAHPFAE